MDRNRGFDINALRQQLEDLFEDFMPSGSPRRPSGGRGGDQAQQLPANVTDTEDAFLVSFPLPGYRPEDIDITVRGQNLSFRAQRKNPPAERPNYVRREWGQGPVQRSLELPAPVDAEHASASFRQGVVTIALPKVDTARSRTIKVEEPATEPEEAEAPEETGMTVEESPAAQTDAAEAGGLEPTESPQERERGGGRRGAFYMPRQPQAGRRQSQAERRAGEAPETEAEQGPTMDAKTEPAEVIARETADEESITDAGVTGGKPDQEAPEAKREEAASAAPAPEEDASAVTPEREEDTAERVRAASEEAAKPVVSEEDADVTPGKGAGEGAAETEEKP